MDPQGLFCPDIYQVIEVYLELVDVLDSVDGMFYTLYATEVLDDDVGLDKLLYLIPQSVCLEYHETTALP